jgi:hypothetical protein
VTDTQDAEARAAAEAEGITEAELDDDEANHEAEREAAPEPQPEPEPSALANVNAIGKKLDTEDRRHHAALAKVLGEDFALYHECPLCLTLGYALPAMPGQFDPNQRMAVLAAMGDEPEPELNEAPEAKRCDVCDGWGELLTGSRNDTGRVKLCARCEGKGWIANLEDGAQNGAGAGVGYTLPPPAQQWPPVPNNDAWGRPAGHPHWGQDPASVGMPT